MPAPWGAIKLQIFGNMSMPNAKPLIGLTGYLDNSNSFKPLAEYLNKSGYYVISVDYPGHGLSSPLPAGMPFTPFNALICLRRVVKFLELKKFSFLTHSFGSFIGFMVKIF